MRRFVERVRATHALLLDPFELPLAPVELDLGLADLGSTVTGGLRREQQCRLGRLQGGGGFGHGAFELGVGDAGVLEDREPGARLLDGLVHLRALLRDALEAGLGFDEPHFHFRNPAVRARLAARARSGSLRSPRRTR